MLRNLPARNKTILAENIRRHKKLCFPGPGSGARLAAAAGVSPKTVSKWLDGSRTPTFEQLYRLSIVFNVSPLELCGVGRDQFPVNAESLRGALDLLDHDAVRNPASPSGEKARRRIKTLLRNEIRKLEKKDKIRRA